MNESMPSGAEATNQITQLACLLAQTESPVGTVDTWIPDDWNTFSAGAYFAQTAMVMYFQRHGMLPGHPDGA